MSGSFVWATWRSLTPRHFAYAALWGIGLGTALGIGAATWMPRPFWKGFAGMFVPTVALAMILLLCLSVAACVRVKWLPRWAPYVIAATVGTILSNVLDLFAISGLLNDIELSLRLIWFNLPPALVMGVLAALGYMHGTEASRRTTTLRRLQMDRTRIAREAYEARLLALQARVEPRFLFDTLADVEAAYASEYQRGERILDSLIDYLRAALPAHHETTPTLAAELRLARSWLELMRARRHDRPAFSIVVDGEAGNAFMPPMVLLPVVQRAVGMDATTELDGKSFRLEHVDVCADSVTVRAVAGEGCLRVTVGAPGYRRAAASDAPTLAMVRERLTALYGESASLRIAVSAAGDEEVYVEIPFERADRDPR